MIKAAVARHTKISVKMVTEELTNATAFKVRELLKNPNNINIQIINDLLMSDELKQWHKTQDSELSADLLDIDALIGNCFQQN